VCFIVLGALKASITAALPEIHVAHAAVARDLFGCSLDQHLSLHQHRYPARKTEHYIHVVLDDEDGDVARKVVERRDDGNAK